MIPSLTCLGPGSGSLAGNGEQGEEADGALHPGNKERAGVWLVFTRGF